MRLEFSKSEVANLPGALEIAKQEIREERVKREEAEQALAALKTPNRPTVRSARHSGMLLATFHHRIILTGSVSFAK
jgi:hypothetical protein